MCTNQESSTCNKRNLKQTDNKDLNQAITKFIQSLSPKEDYSSFNQPQKMSTETFKLKHGYRPLYNI